jgi:chromosome segregation ATPase
MQGSLQQQQHAIAERDEEILRLQKAVRERDDELGRRDGALAKLQKAREAELSSLKAALTKEKEEKLAKLSAAHNKRNASKDEEIAAARASLQRDRDKELARLEALHAKQLRARDEEVASAKAALAKEKDERISKLNATIKELKGARRGTQRPCEGERARGRRGETARSLAPLTCAAPEAAHPEPRATTSASACTRSPRHARCSRARSEFHLDQRPEDEPERQGGGGRLSQAVCR